MRILFLLTIVVPYIKGECFLSYGRVDRTETGRLVPVCEFNGLDILDKSSFRTASCMSCNCNNAVLECCGFGVAGEVVSPPPGCDVIADGCNPVYVLQADRSLDCQTFQPININNVYPDISSVFPGLFDSVSGGNQTDQTAGSSNATTPTVSQPPMYAGPVIDATTLPQMGGMQDLAGMGPPNQGQYNTLGNFLLWDMYV